MPQTEPDHRRKVEEIAEVIEEIGNDWEIGFIDNLQNEWKGDFSHNQKVVIDRLYERACESGL